MNSGESRSSPIDFAAIDSPLMEERLTRTLDWLFSLEARGEIYKLERMENALALLGNPHRKLRACISRTKGKGSVAAMLIASARGRDARRALRNRMRTWRRRGSTDARYPRR